MNPERLRLRKKLSLLHFEDISIDGATGIIINISGNESLTMHETNEA